MFRTCNTWTNQALKVASMKTCVGAAFEGGILAKFTNEHKQKNYSFVYNNKRPQYSYYI